ncbi:SAM-dependent methyltransferase [Crocosphaera sp.]|uniref:SAM-dependent methyltransferase n=1 Tax=Crocosphaera sp. TaxID=2729996 RepID=UPI0026128436|nr:SAM-dependent methyltransferase [Crocosphaera sp.]MDJ0582256.1 SAM-dependent methyltransferase [Crocosphaera sp.]
MNLEKVVPFGRSLDEYIKMFNLTENDFKKSILSVADGPASFNAEGTKLGYKINSVDPLYIFSGEEIKRRFCAVVDDIIKQVENTPNDWVWSYHKSPQNLRKNREKVIALFCADYEIGKKDNRYNIGQLPRLKYDKNQYELGLVSHFLFLYSAHFDQQFHINSIDEILRICREVRIFPLITLQNKISPYLQFIITYLENKGYKCKLEKVSYQLQRGGNQMLIITK